MSISTYVCFCEPHSGRISLNLVLESFIKTCFGNIYLIEIGQIYMEFYLKTNMQVLLWPTALNSHKSPFRMKLYQAVRIAFEAEILRERPTMLCYT